MKIFPLRVGEAEVFIPEALPRNGKGDRACYQHSEYWVSDCTGNECSSAHILGTGVHCDVACNSCDTEHDKEERQRHAEQ